MLMSSKSEFEIVFRKNSKNNSLTFLFLKWSLHIYRKKAPFLIFIFFFTLKALFNFQHNSKYAFKST